MGLMRFKVHDRDRIPPGGLGQVYMSGADEIPWYGRAYMSGDQLIVERAVSDSGSVWAPWRIDSYGVVLLGTSTLMEREEPYQLEVELARGTVNRLRTQMAQWEQLGLVVSNDLREDVLAATRHFSRAATAVDEQSKAEAARKALVVAAMAMTRLTGTYTEQATELRRGQNRKLATWFGVHLGEPMPPLKVARQLLPSFNMVSVPLTWRAIEASEGRRNWKNADAQIDWAQTAGLKVVGGPLLELDDRGVPDWTYLWEGDFDSLVGFMMDHVTTVVKRYRGKVNLWQTVARMSHGRVLALSEEQRLQIAAQAIGRVRELDPSTPLIATFDQPWAEYLATEQLDLAPLHFADALVRADLGLSGLGLELNIGYHPGASTHRHVEPARVAAGRAAHGAQLGGEGRASQRPHAGAFERRKRSQPGDASRLDRALRAPADGESAGASDRLESAFRRVAAPLSAWRRFGLARPAKAGARIAAKDSATVATVGRVVARCGCCLPDRPRRCRRSRPLL
jgi:hypothetical protein